MHFLYSGHISQFHFTDHSIALHFELTVSSKLKLTFFLYSYYSKIVKVLAIIIIAKQSYWKWNQLCMSEKQTNTINHKTFWIEIYIQIDYKCKRKQFQTNKNVRKFWRKSLNHQTIISTYNKQTKNTIEFLNVLNEIDGKCSTPKPWLFFETVLIR